MRLAGYNRIYSIHNFLYMTTNSILQLSNEIRNEVERRRYNKTREVISKVYEKANEHNPCQKTVEKTARLNIEGEAKKAVRSNMADAKANLADSA